VGSDITFYLRAMLSGFFSTVIYIKITTTYDENLTILLKTHSKWSKNLNVKKQTFKIIYLCDFGFKKIS
jgi:hypothetical protein